MVALVAMAPAAATAPPCSPAHYFASTVSYLSGSYSIAPALADFDGDGDLDVAVANYGTNDVTVFLNNAFGGFVRGSSTAVSSPSNLAAGDLDNDGFVDLAVTSLVSGSLVVLRADHAGGTWSGTFSVLPTTSTMFEPRDVALADLNEDGRLDAAVAQRSGLTVFLGRLPGSPGTGTFQAPAHFAQDGAWDVCIADFDVDGVLDVAIADYLTPSGIAVFTGIGSDGAGTGGFQAPQVFPITSPPADIVAHDFDLDGKPDLAVPLPNSGGVYVLHNRTSGPGAPLVWTAANYSSYGAPGGVAAGDVDQDGNPDLLATDSYAGTVRFLRGNAATKTFTQGEEYAAGTGPVGIVAADLNGDLALDAAVANTGSNDLSILLSACGAGLPVILDVQPRSVSAGATITITGSRFVQPLSVRIGEVPVTGFESISLNSIVAVVPAGAVTAPLSVTTGYGTTTTPYNIGVGVAPLVGGADPLRAKVGARVTITGAHLLKASRVRFGDGGDAPFTIESDTRLSATVNAGATTGPIRVHNSYGVGASPFVFEVLPLDSIAVIAYVRDVPSDQGGRVVVAWAASDLDVKPNTWVTGYRVWRRAPDVGAEAAEAAGWMRRAVAGPAGTTEDSFWEPLASLPAGYLPGYAYTAATTRDSLPEDNPHAWFMVQTLTTDPFDVRLSDPVDGYSVDNIAPARPRAFAAVYSLDAGVRLRWAPSPEVDLSRYRLHRGTLAGFLPSESNLVAALADTACEDPTGTLLHHYKLAAVDIHGNPSRYAVVSPQGPTAALVSLVSAVAEPGMIRLDWSLPGDPGLPVTVYRRSPDAEWLVMLRTRASSDGHVIVEDRQVEAGARYAYRLGLEDGDSEVFGGEVWLEVPRHALALFGVRPNPSTSEALSVDFAVPTSGTGIVELFDLVGRRVTHRVAELPAAGRHVVPLEGTRSLPAGVYLVRLQFAGESRTSRVVRLR